MMFLSFRQLLQVSGCRFHGNVGRQMQHGVAAAAPPLRCSHRVRSGEVSRAMVSPEEEIKRSSRQHGRLRFQVVFHYHVLMNNNLTIKIVYLIIRHF